MESINNNYFISIIIPFRNEEKFIESCLKSVLSFKGLTQINYEILLIDGLSTDNSLEIIEKVKKNHPLSYIKVITNPKIIQSVGLNIGIREAKGEFIMRLDAHSSYPESYLEDLLETSLRTKSENVGGVIITRPYDESYSAQLVQALTTHKFGVGNSGFRVGATEGIADTVPYGFFKKGVFDKAGYFDERLVRAQDYEFNRRIAQVGGKIWINPAIQLQYFNQPNLFKFLKKQLFKEAPYNAFMWYLAPYTFNLRHSITIFFSLGIIVGGIASFFSMFIFYIYLSILILYGLLAVVSSFQQARRYKKYAHILVLPFGFFLFHFLHGLGILSGCLTLLFKQASVQRSKYAWHDKIIPRYTKAILDELSLNSSKPRNGN